MKHRILIRLAIAVALSIVAAVPARAQIYTWRDANGNLVLSDRPRDGWLWSRLSPCQGRTVSGSPGSWRRIGAGV